jgi:hypothetical protein
MLAGAGAAGGALGPLFSSHAAPSQTSLHTQLPGVPTVASLHTLRSLPVAPGQSSTLLHPGLPFPGMRSAMPPPMAPTMPPAPGATPGGSFSRGNLANGLVEALVAAAGGGSSATSTVGKLAALVAHLQEAAAGGAPPPAAGGPAASFLPEAQGSGAGPRNSLSMHGQRQAQQHSAPPEGRANGQPQQQPSQHSAPPEGRANGQPQQQPSQPVQPPQVLSMLRSVPECHAPPPLPPAPLQAAMEQGGAQGQVDIKQALGGPPP